MYVLVWYKATEPAAIDQVFNRYGVSVQDEAKKKY